MSGRGCQGSRRGLTVMDLIIPAALVGVIAVFGLRQVGQARQSVREELALQNLRTLGTACRWYRQATSTYPDSLLRLGLPDSDPPYVPSVLALREPVRQGYVFTYRSAAGGFEVQADPTEHGGTGRRHFLIDQTLAVRSTTEDRFATPADPVFPTEPR